MGIESQMPEVIRFITRPAPETKENLLIHSNGSEIYVYDAQIISLFSRYLGVRYEVATPAGGAGQRLPDGNWTGALGMIHRSEADLAMSELIMNEERYNHISFSEVYFQSAVSFMAEKPVPVSENFRMVHPFSFGVWGLLLVSVVAVSFLLYVLKRRQVAFHRVILSTLVNVLEQSIQFETGSLSLRLFASMWLLAMVVIINSYKGLLLSFLSFPNMKGIRDFSDLSKAASDNSFLCLTLKNGYYTKSFLESEDDSRKEIGECLKRNEVYFGGDTDFFLDATTTKKAYIASRSILNPYKRDFFVSQDSYQMVLSGIPYSKSFCCPRELNKFIRRCVDTGVFLKLFDDYEFILMIKRPLHKSNRIEGPSKIHLENLTGAFSLLLFGWLLSCLTLLAEIVFKKYQCLS